MMMMEAVSAEQKGEAPLQSALTIPFYSAEAFRALASDRGEGFTRLSAELNVEKQSLLKRRRGAL